MTSLQLAELLHLEKSSVSRMIRKLIENDELRETTDARDARFKLLSLTTRGKRTLAAINEFGQRQVADALGQLTEAEQRIVRDGLTIYAHALRMTASD